MGSPANVEREVENNMKNNKTKTGYNLSVEVTAEQKKRINERIRGIEIERGEDVSIRNYLRMAIEADLRAHETPADERPAGKKERVK